MASICTIYDAYMPYPGSYYVHVCGYIGNIGYVSVYIHINGYIRVRGCVTYVTR